MFAAIVRASLRQRLLVIVGSLVLLVYGAMSLGTLQLDVLPDLNKTTVAVMTEAPGMASEEVENLVTYPVELAVMGLPQVTRVQAVSSVGLSVVYVQFDWDSDVYRSRQQVTERLESISGQLPKGIKPRLGAISSIMGEIMLVAVYDKSGAQRGMETRDVADNVIKPRLLAIPGVSQITSIGGEVREYRVSPNVGRMRALNVSIDELSASVAGFSQNTAGGYLNDFATEYVIRNVVHTTKLDDLSRTPVTYRDGRPILLNQLAAADFQPMPKRGDASLNGRPSVILSIQKQPGTDTIRLTRQVEAALGSLQGALPAGFEAEVLFRQADFINHSIDNLVEALADASIIVMIVLFMFLMSARLALISLLAIPVSLLVTIIVFRYSGMSINTMTLGGLAIAVGELVDDAVVGVENVFRRLRQRAGSQVSALQIVGDATVEVRSAIYYATLIIALVFIPLFSLPGLEGRMFVPFGIAYVASILISMVVSITLTPVLCYHLLPASTLAPKPDPFLLKRLKSLNERILYRALAHPQRTFGLGAAFLGVTVIAMALLPRNYLPPFNEGSVTVNLFATPGISLPESDRIGRLAEGILESIPNVAKVGRRTGRAEMDEHAMGVHYSEIEVALDENWERHGATIEEMRRRLSALPVPFSIGQPISHRVDHLLSGVRAPLVIKIFGDDMDQLRRSAGALHQRLAPIEGIADLQVEKQTEIPQLQIRVSPDKAAAYGVTPASLAGTLNRLLLGSSVSQVFQDNRRYDVVLRLPENRRESHALADLLVETPRGPVRLADVADIVESVGPNEILHEGGIRRIAVFGSLASDDVARMGDEVRAAVAALELPPGYSVSIEGQFRAQEDAAQNIGVLALVALLMSVVLLYNRYRSLTLSAIILVNVPMALAGSLVALWISDNPLSIPSLVGLITVAGISVRNGILKISHYINLALHEREPFGIPLIVRGSLERLAPVMMTALSAALAMLPLLFAGDAPGKEVLHPIGIVVFGGLLSATLLDAVLTPVLFHRFGEKPLGRLLDRSRSAAESY